jgi:hypothetical protein
MVQSTFRKVLPQTYTQTHMHRHMLL